MNASASSAPRIVSREEWLAARRSLLDEEKQLTRRQDRLNEARRNLPWVKVEKEYLFDTPEGKASLADLFAGRSQLIVKHFMLSPGRDICVGCSFELDHIEAALVHLENHDVSFAAVSRAPLRQIEAARRRMAWKCRWVSSHESDFNYDFNVSFRREDLARGPVFYNYALQNIPIEDLSGISVFCREGNGEVFHTYSTFGRGAEYVMSAYVLLDLTPRGRNETGPHRNLTDWVRPHDRYGVAGRVDATGQFVAEEGCCHR